jgi:hypothetical protein
MCGHPPRTNAESARTRPQSLSVANAALVVTGQVVYANTSGLDLMTVEGLGMLELLRASCLRAANRSPPSVPWR